MKIRTVIGWRTRLAEIKHQQHRLQFAKARMPGKEALKFKRSATGRKD